MAPRKKKKTRRRKRRTSGRRSPVPLRKKLLWLGIPAGVLMVFTLYVGYLDLVIRDQFEGKKWAVPARVYARPLEIFPQSTLTQEELVQELDLLGYRRVKRVRRPGEYASQRGKLTIYARSFRFADGAEPTRLFAVHFGPERISRVVDLHSRENLSLLRLEPYQFASITPAHNEDRILVTTSEVPPLLIKALVAVEDRRFFEHWGIDPKGLARAFLANLKAGRIVQGGSTLTQQLVKNFFLTHERTLWRKLKEAVMALLLDWHYSKEEILEGYLNEIYLGQDGDRAIHGFGLASAFYFGVPLEDLSLPEQALLVGMVKGPSFYEPRRHPQRALERRNQVLDVMFRQRLLSEREYQRARASELTVVPLNQVRGLSRFPAFVDLVRAQLRSDYKDEDLRSEGLQIFTTLDPLVQFAAEQAVSRQLAAIEEFRGMERGSLEAAAVVTNTGTGEVVALVGGREPRFAGFNRALSARRQVGSIIKPAVYLTALRKPDQYTLASLLSDEPVSIQDEKGNSWEPQNFDNTFHGTVPLYQALSQSINVATVRLGLDVGVSAVIRTLADLGVDGAFKPYPSLLLGAVELTPVEVAQMYQTLADGGFQTPLRSIRDVLDAKGESLQRYSIRVNQHLEPGPVYLLNHALQRVVREGTAQGLRTMLSDAFNVAGKTGTTNDLRDSWFAGFTGDHVAVVWVGRDDNRSAGLSGSTGALRIWGKLMQRVRPAALVLPEPPDIEPVLIDLETGLRATRRCRDAVELPFLAGSEPRSLAPCAGGGPLGESLKAPLEWLKGLF